MTIIAAYISKEENRVYIASDDVATSDTYKEHRQDPKIIKLPEDNPRMLIGFCGFYNVIQELRLATIIIPKNSRGITMLQFVRDQIRPILEPLASEENFIFDLLIAFDSKIFRIAYDYTVAEVVGNYNAIGTGRDYAIGALYATDKNPLLSARDKLTIAIEAAIKNDLFSGGEPNIEYI